MNLEEIFYEMTNKLNIPNVKINEPMCKHTSFKIGGNADIFVTVRNIEELKKVQEIAKKHDIPITIIGNGSNILVKDNGIRGIVVKISLQELEIIEFEGTEKNENVDNNLITRDEAQAHMLKENKETVIVKVGAGMQLGKLAQILSKKGISGFEFASGIPGTIGGAIKMNAGAYGGEMKNIVIKTTYMNEQGEIKTLENEEQQFLYRHSIFSKRPYIILQTILKLQKGNPEEIKAKMQEYAGSRKEKQPIKMPSAGSTFKRGEGYITAKLIDECGLKGFQIGDAAVSEKHAGFLINKGKATAEDMLKLIEYVQKKVEEKFGFKIELEIEILGE